VVVHLHALEKNWLINNYIEFFKEEKLVMSRKKPPALTIPAGADGGAPASEATDSPDTGGGIVMDSLSTE
jgi:hypothetical protein